MNSKGKISYRNSWEFLLILLVYLAFTIIVFSAFFGGWAGVLLVLPLTLLVSIIVIVGSLIGSIVNTVKKRLQVGINSRQVKILITLQLITILLSGGDCGDNSGTHSIIQYVFSPDSVCSESYGKSKDIVSNIAESAMFISYLFLFAYFGYLITFTFKTYRRHQDESLNA